MSLSAIMIYEVRTTGSDTQCSGGFNPTAGGTDYTLQSAAQFSGTDLVINATTNTIVTSATHNFVSADVGNTIRVTGAGTGFVITTYEIISVSANAATLDRSPGPVGSTGGVWWEGGAFASPGKAAGVMNAGNDMFIKAGTYTITSATPNISGGCLSLTTQTSNANLLRVIGYTTNRNAGNTDVRPLIKADNVITNFVLITSNTGNIIENLELNGNSRGTSAGLNCASGSGHAYRVKGSNFTNYFINSGSATMVAQCEATGCSGTPFQGGYFYFCTAYSNTNIGFSGTITIGCISVNNSGAGSDGFVVPNQGQMINCTAYGNGRNGFNLTAGAGGNTLINCLAVNNAGYGYTASAAADGAYLFNCAGYNNTSGLVNTSFILMAQQIGLVTLTAAPFNNAAGNDFSLNNVVGGGRLLRAGGIPNVANPFPSLSTPNYLDIGAAQHIDAGNIFPIKQVSAPHRRIFG